MSNWTEIYLKERSNWKQIYLRCNKNIIDYCQEFFVGVEIKIT